MTRILTLSALTILALDPGWCQEIAKRPAFEVASITPCKPGTPAPEWEHAGIAPFASPGGRFTARATTIQFLLEWAYGVQPSQHTGGPGWMATDRYDILAKAESDATEAQMKLMAQTLLEERFHLKLHRERKTLPVLMLSVGKAPLRLFPPNEGEAHSIQVAPQMGPDRKTASFRVAATRFSMAQLADTFARQFGRIIVDGTGLNGEFDFTMDLTPDESQPNPLDTSHLIAALQQLGLALKPAKAPADMLAIDGVEKVAAGNE